MWKFSVQWEALQILFSGHRSNPISQENPIVVPSSDTATTLGAAILAGVGVGMYQDYDEAIRLTVKETRRHEPNPENRDVYEKTYKTYLNLYKSLEPMMRNEEEK